MTFGNSRQAHGGWSIPHEYNTHHYSAVVSFHCSKLSGTWVMFKHPGCSIVFMSSISVIQKYKTKCLHVNYCTSMKRKVIRIQPYLNTQSWINRKEPHMVGMIVMIWSEVRPWVISQSHKDWCHDTDTDPLIWTLFLTNVKKHISFHEFQKKTGEMTPVERPGANLPSYGNRIKSQRPIFTQCCVL